MSGSEKQRRAKGRVLEKLIALVIEDLHLPFRHVCFMNHLNQKGSKYPDHSSDLCDIEAKYWCCMDKDYTIDLHRYHTQIGSRYDPKKHKLLVIAQAKWSPHAITVARFNGVHIINLECGDIENNYSYCYYELKRRLKKYFISKELYCGILIGTEIGNLSEEDCILYSEYFMGEVEKFNIKLDYMRQFVRLRE